MYEEMGKNFSYVINMLYYPVMNETHEKLVRRLESYQKVPLLKALAKLEKCILKYYEYISEKIQFVRLLLFNLERYGKSNLTVILYNQNGCLLNRQMLTC